jgi:DNA-binding transcriptional regulator YdaS (Cro superfamily)
MWTDIAIQKAGGRPALARLLGVSPQAVAFWIAGHRVPDASTCVRIEQATEREVRRWDLRPDDWWEIWPELIGTDGAPPVPTREAA